MIDYIGAPEEIRTPDPQIRSLRPVVEFSRLRCKPTPKPATDNQSVSHRFANRRDGKPKAAPPDPEKTKPAATAIANGLSEIYRGERFQNVAQAARTGKAGAP